VKAVKAPGAVEARDNPLLMMFEIVIATDRLSVLE
jgi:hypothetical protein